MKHDEDEQEKQVIASRIQTPDGTILWSRHVHDYVTYKDANGEEYMLDGGNDYCRTSVNNVPATPIPIFDDEPWEVQRQYRLWGTCGMRVPVGCLSNEHLENIIRDGYKNKGILTEYEYRMMNHIIVPEHDYENEQALAITKPKGVE